MSGLVEFLKARLAEEQAEAEKLVDLDDYPLDPWEIKREETGEWNSYAYLRVAKRRVLAEIEARRAVLRMWEQLRQFHESGDGYGLADGTASRVVQLLAFVYADHPDYREEWKP